MANFKLINYDNCITNLTSSIQNHFNIKPNHKTMPIVDEYLKQKDYKNVIIMVFDAMGSAIIDKNTTENNYLRKKKVADFYSTYPPTTANCTTAYLSGLNPVESGWLGWSSYFKQINRAVDNFTNADSETKQIIEGENIANKYLPFKTIGEQITEQNPDISYHSFWPSFREDGCVSLKQLENRLTKLCNAEGKKYIYVYWTEPDHTMHEIGTQNNMVKKILNDISKFLKKFERKTSDSIAFVSADHGQIDVTPIEFYTYYDVYNCLKIIPSCDSRTPFFFIKEGMEQQFKNLFNKYFSDYYDLYTKEEIINLKIFGEGKQHPLFEDLLGDFIGIAKDKYYFNFIPNGIMFKGHHAGLCKDEMEIPLIIINN